MTVGQRIRAARLGAGLTLRQVADASGCCLQTIWRYEHKSEGWDAERLYRIAAACGVPIEALLSDHSSTHVSNQGNGQ